MINRPTLTTIYREPPPDVGKISALIRRNRMYLKYEGNAAFTPINPGMVWSEQQQRLVDQFTGNQQDIDLRMRHLIRKMMHTQPRGRAYQRMITREINRLTMYNPN